MNMDKESIKELRRNLKLSQEKFAVKVGVATMTIRRWESGSSTPNQLGQEKLKHIQFRYRQNNPLKHVGKTEQVLGLNQDELAELKELVKGVKQ